MRVRVFAPLLSVVGDDGSSSRSCFINNYLCSKFGTETIGLWILVAVANSGEEHELVVVLKVRSVETKYNAEENHG